MGTNVVSIRDQIVHDHHNCTTDKEIRQTDQLYYKDATGTLKLLTSVSTG